MTAIAPVIEEPRFVHTVGQRTYFDYTRLTQFGRLGGLDRARRRTDHDRRHHSRRWNRRDRSWGQRPVGPSTTGPTQRAAVLLAVGADRVRRCVYPHRHHYHEADGRAWHESGAVVPRLADGEPALDPGRCPARHRHRIRRHVAIGHAVGGADHDPARNVGERRRRCVVRTVPHVPDERDRLPPPGVGSRCWVGNDESTRDQLVLADVNPLDPLMVHVQALSRRATWGERSGVGIVEQLVIGPHQRSA